MTEYEKWNEYEKRKSQLNLTCEKFEAEIRKILDELEL
jgi:hypothetical protein